MIEEPRLRPPWTFLDLVKVILASLGAMFVVVVVASAVGVDESDLAFGGMFVISFYVVLAFFAWFFAIRRRGVDLSEAGFGPPGPRFVPRVIGWYVVGLIGQGIAFAISGPFLGEGPGTEEQLGLPETKLPFVVAAIAVVSAVVVAPVVEEFLFRGLLYRYLRARMPVSLAMVLTSAPFAAAHVFLPLIPALFVFGLLLNYVAERYDSLYPSIGIHMLQNGLAVAIVLS